MPLAFHSISASRSFSTCCIEGCKLSLPVRMKDAQRMCVDGNLHSEYAWYAVWADDRVMKVSIKVSIAWKSLADLPSTRRCAWYCEDPACPRYWTTWFCKSDFCIFMKRLCIVRMYELVQRLDVVS